MSNRRTRRNVGAKGMLAGLLVALVVLMGCEGQDLSISEQVQRAKQAQSEGAYREAAIHLKKVLQQRPDHPEARRLLGKLQLRLGKGPAAEKELRKGLDLGVPRAEIWQPLVEAQLLQRHYREALQTLDQTRAATTDDEARREALRSKVLLHLGRREQARQAMSVARSLSPALPQVRTEQARLLAANGERQEGIRLLREVVGQHPDQTDAWDLLGDLWRLAGDLDQAEQAYSRAAEHQAYASGARWKRALVRLARDDLAGARKDVAVLQEMAPRGPRLPYLRGLLEFKAGNLGESASHFQEVLDRQHAFLPARYYLGAIHYRQGRYNQAEAFLQKVVAGEQASDSAKALLAAVYLETDRPQEASRLLAPLVGRHAQEPAFLALAGRAALAQGRTREGIDYLQKVAQLAPDSARVQRYLGAALLVGGKAAEGEHALQEAIRIAPGDEEARTLLVLGRMRNGQADKALAFAQEWAREAGDNPLPVSLSGVILLSQDKKAAAREAFRRAWQRRPGDPAAGYYLAAFDLRENAVGDALRRYRQVLEHNPDNLPSRLALARLVWQQGDAEGALEILAEAAAEGGRPDRRLQALRARLHLAQGRPNVALEGLRGGGDQAPPEILALRGRAYMALADWASARAELAALVELRPGSATGRYLLARALERQGDKPRALEQLRKALELAPGQRGYRFGLVRLLAKNGELAKAEAELAPLQEALGDQPRILSLKGQIALLRGKEDEAVALIQRAYSARRNNLLAVQLANAYWHTGQPEAGNEVLAAWLGDHPDDPLSRTVLADYLLRQGRLRAAAEHYRVLLTDDANNVHALNNLAWIRFRQGALGEARDLAERAVDLAPRQASVRDTLGRIHLAADQPSLAVRHLRRAVDLVPDDPALRLRLGRAQVRNGDRHAARVTLERLLNRWPAFPQREAAQQLLSEIGPAPDKDDSAA